jgi:hypothetical protein
MVQMVEDDPFIPLRFQKDHSGMQGTEYFTDWRDKVCRLNWIIASQFIAFAAKKLHKLGITKQLCNRLLEPFLYHTVIVTASEWENFFSLRAHPAAEIHIDDLAEKMLIAYNESTPKQLEAGEWHIPFGDQFDEQRLFDLAEELQEPWEEGFRFHRHHVRAVNDLKLKIATARCARVSYMNFEGKDDYKADIGLHDKLDEQGHYSPFEHCGQAMNEEQINSESYNDDDGDDGTWGWSGNFHGFIQYRKFLHGENRTDSRVIKK